MGVHVRDNDLWQKTRSDLLGNDGELGKAFLAFVIDWCETAEHAMTQVDSLQAAEALRGALPAVEYRHGTVSLSVLAQALVVILANWSHASELHRQLTVIEMRVLTDMLALKQQELEVAAQALPGGT